MRGSAGEREGVGRRPLVLCWRVIRAVWGNVSTTSNSDLIPDKLETVTIVDERTDQKIRL